MPSIAPRGTLSGPCRPPPPPRAQPFSPPSSLAPLVRKRHIDQDPDLTDDYLNACWETYIIEPQSGTYMSWRCPTNAIESPRRLSRSRPTGQAAGTASSRDLWRYSTYSGTLPSTTPSSSFSPVRNSPPSSPNLRTPPRGTSSPLESAYIGLVEETGSLFAMSADRFPLVAFAGRRKRRENAMKSRSHSSEDEKCLGRASSYTDRRCLVGMHPLEAGDGDSPENRLKRLVDGVPGVVHATEDACPVVRIDKFAAKLDGQSSQPVVD
ncbi:hypothetical protein B0H14DRAFT_3510200 [Mycena olivaceomarginata]|nr:hypothetical protein B0H14DRAFT_3510200 [Mycena olivaceomarginata]